MKTFLSVAIVLLLASCSDSGSVIHQQLSDSDSLIIQFNKPQTDSIKKIVTTIEVQAIEKLIRFVDNKNKGEYKCSYDGNLMFYANRMLIGDVAFNYSSENCKHFTLSAGDKLISTAMSNEAADFLKSLAEGRDWY